MRQINSSLSVSRGILSERVVPENSKPTTAFPLALCWSVKYVGSFLVPELSDKPVSPEEESKTDFVGRQLVALRGLNTSKTVLLVISVGGIKMCSADGKTVHMAHALKRVSYATCDPENRQFAFLAREPRKNNNNGLQFCHVFNTETTEEAEEINSVVGNAFRAAYLYRIKQETEATKKKLKETDKPGFSPTSTDLKRLTEAGREQTEIESARNSEKEIEHGKRKDLDKEAKDPQPSEVMPVATSTAVRSPNKESCKTPQLENGVPLTPKIVEKPQNSPPQSEARLRKKLNGYVTPPERCSPIYGNRDSIILNEQSPAIPLSRPPRNRPISMIIPSRNCVSRIREGHEWTQSNGELNSSKLSQRSARGSIMKKLFRRSKTPSTEGSRQCDGGPGFAGFVDHCQNGVKLYRRSQTPSAGVSRNLDGVTAVDGFAEDSANGVSLRGNNKERKRRPVSEIVSDVIRGFGAGLNLTRNDAARTKSGLRKEGSPRLSVKSLNVTVSKSVGEQWQKEPAMGAMDKKLRRSANLEQLFRVREITGGSVSNGEKNQKMRLKQSPGGTGCGPACQFIGVSPEMGQRNSEILLPVDTQDEMRLKGQVWFRAEASRDTVVRVLKESPEGAFVVRRSATQRCCLAISVRVPVRHNFQQVSHYLILKTNRGFKLKGFTKVFPSVQSLVTHHSIMPEQLPCRLRFINWQQNTFHNVDCEPNGSSFSSSNQGSEQIYGSLGD